MISDKKDCAGCFINDNLECIYPDEMWRYNCPIYSKRDGSCGKVITIEELKLLGFTLEGTVDPAVLKKEQMKVLKTINDAFVTIVSEKEGG